MRATIELAIGGWAFAILLGIPTGVLAAVKRGKWMNQLIVFMTGLRRKYPDLENKT